MAKKSSKKQLNTPTTTIVSDRTPVTVPATAEDITSTSQPADTSQVDTAATRLQFFDFITLAATDNVKEFLKLASTKPEAENLVTLWRRAHSEGYEKGRKSALRHLEKKLEEKYEEGVEKGMDLGREQGYTIAKETFDDIVKHMKDRESQENQYQRRRHPNMSHNTRNHENRHH